MALPAVGASSEPDEILSRLLDALLETLRLDLIVMRSNDLRIMRVSAPLEGISLETDVRQALDLSRGDAGSARVVIKDIEVSVAFKPLGLEGEMGMLVAGCQRLDFPRESEQLLLDVAAMQAAIGLHRADALEGRERNLKLFIDTIPALAWSARPDGSAQFFNKPYLDFVGLSAEEAGGWGWTVAVHPEDLPGLAATWQRVLASEAPGGPKRDCAGMMESIDGFSSVQIRCETKMATSSVGAG